MRTITFDEAIYRLVPMAVTEEMVEAAMFAAGERKSIVAKVAAAISVVPADLPGVVEHNGGLVYMVCFSDLCGSSEVGKWREATEDAYYTFTKKTRRILFTHPPAQSDTAMFNAMLIEASRIDGAMPDIAALPDQDGFEAWSKREGAMNLKPAHTMYCEDGRFPATYFYAHTETAWRAWANSTANNTAALQARIAELEAQLAAQAGLADILREAALIIGEIKMQNAPLSYRGPIVDELEGFALMVAAQAGQDQDQHFDNIAVDAFAKMMKEKLAKSREKGRSGWNDPSQCTIEHLNSLLLEHIRKGDPVDVANFCMMLGHYDAKVATPPAPANPLSIVQSALEAALNICSIAAENEEGPSDCIRAIRAINPQTIIDAARSK